MPYRTTRALEYPTSPAVLRKLRAGENLSLAERQHKRVRAGTIVTDLPEESVKVLLKKGWIENLAEDHDDTEE